MSVRRGRRGWRQGNQCACSTFGRSAIPGQTDSSVPRHRGQQLVSGQLRGPEVPSSLCTQHPNNKHTSVPKREHANDPGPPASNSLCSSWMLNELVNHMNQSKRLRHLCFNGAEAVQIAERKTLISWKSLLPTFSPRSLLGYISVSGLHVL